MPGRRQFDGEAGMLLRQLSSRWPWGSTRFLRFLAEPSGILVHRLQDRTLNKQPVSWFRPGAFAAEFGGFAPFRNRGILRRTPETGRQRLASTGVTQTAPARLDEGGVTLRRSTLGPCVSRASIRQSGYWLSGVKLSKLGMCCRTSAHVAR